MTISSSADGQLPSVGDLDWGGPLNSEILFDEAAIGTLQTGLNNHMANSGAALAAGTGSDVHGDRAYASNLIGPLTFGVNNGVTAVLPTDSGGLQTGVNDSAYVKLVPNGLVNSINQGVIPYSLLPGGAGLTNFVDVVKDYGAVGNGTTDDSGVIQDALNAIATAGGGVVFLPGGYDFGIASTLVIGANTWLMISPDAFITRIDVGAGPPTVMLANWKSGSTPATGNILVTGGVWNFSNKSTSGEVFSFANCKSLTIQNTNVEARPDGASPVGKFFGCSFVLLDNIVTTAGTPTVSRASVAAHVFEFRYLNSTNISGLASAAYTYNKTTNPLFNSNVQVRNCPLNVATSNDADGNYCGWYSMCGNWESSEPDYSVGSTPTVHIYFIIVGCSATCLTQCGISFYNCNYVTHKGCAYNYPPAPYFQGWVGTGPTTDLIIWDTEGNAPEKFVAVLTNYPSNVVTEDIIVQHAIPAYDWLPGSSAYSFDGTGHCGFGTISGLYVTFKMYIGVLGTKSDTLVGTLGPCYFNNSAASSSSNIPWHLHCHHIGIDSDSKWWPGEFSLSCSVLDSSTGSGGQIPYHNGCCNNYYDASAVVDEIIFITITATFSAAHTTNIWYPHNHVCRRERT